MNIFGKKIGLSGFLLLFLILFFPEVKAGIKPSVMFRSFTLSDGLPHITVTSLMQDSRGFMFVSTFDGLGIFDGNVFRNYKSDHLNDRSLIHNRVQTTFEHSSGKIFIGTERGVCLYDPVLDAFTETGIQGLDGQFYFVQKFFEATDGKLWILTRTNFLMIACLETNHLERISVLGQTGREFSGFTDIAEDQEGNVWIISESDMVLYSKDGENLSKVDLNLQESHVLNVLNSIKIDDSNNHLWIATDNGLFQLRYDTRSENVDLYVINHYLPGKLLNRLLIDKNGDIWVSESENGLYRLFIASDGPTHVEHYIKNTYCDHSLQGNMITYLYEDCHGGLWVAVHSYGLNYYNPNQIFFKTFNEQSGLFGEHIISAAAFDADRVLLGSFRKGISVFNFAKNRIEHPWL